MTNFRLISLWMAYVLLVLTSWYGLWTIGNSLESLEQDVCQAIVLDLTVQANIVKLLPAETDESDQIFAAIDDVEAICGS